MSISRAEVNSYKYNESGKYAGISAGYVIAHAARQLQRGKGPSVAFLGHKNPQEALQAAVEVQQKSEAIASQDPTLRTLAAEYALYGAAQTMHVWGE